MMDTVNTILSHVVIAILPLTSPFLFIVDQASWIDSAKLIKNTQSKKLRRLGTAGPGTPINKHGAVETEIKCPYV